MLQKILILAFLVSPMAVQAQDAEAGKKIFTTQKCNECHSVKSAGISKVEGAEDADKKERDDREPPDLSAVGLERKADWIEKYLQKKVEIKEKKHKKRFQGNDEERRTIAKWLESLKTKK